MHPYLFVQVEKVKLKSQSPSSSFDRIQELYNFYIYICLQDTVPYILTVYVHIHRVKDIYCFAKIQYCMITKKNT